MRLLIAERSEREARGLRALFEQHRFAVDVVADGGAALERLLGEGCEIAVMDATLLGHDGGSVLSRVRSYGARTLVLVLSASGAVGDRVRALEDGADDYLVKPFAERELVARVIALSRRALRAAPRELLAHGRLEVDATARFASCEGRELPLSATEFRLLLYFLRNSGVMLSRRQIFRHVWSRELESPTNVVDVYVGSLRRKLAAGGCGVIETVHRGGWRLERARAG